MKVRDDKGSVTMFVLVALLFMSGYLLVLYGNNVNKSKIAKEQFDTISSIYSYNDSDASAYERAYTALRGKNKDILTASVTNSSKLELTGTFEEEVSNYKIYGGTTSLGTYDSSTGKYIIQIVLTNEAGESKTYSTYLSSQLTSSDYIDYKNQKIVSGSQTKEIVSLPTIYAYEEYTKIEVIANATPAKIEVEYIGYTL